MARKESATTLSKKIIVLLYFVVCRKKTIYKQLRITFTTSVSLISFYMESVDFSYVFEKRVSSDHLSTQEHLNIVNLDRIQSFRELQTRALILKHTWPIISFRISSI